MMIASASAKISMIPPLFRAARSLLVREEESDLRTATGYKNLPLPENKLPIVPLDIVRRMNPRHPVGCIDPLVQDGGAGRHVVERRRADN